MPNKRPNLLYIFPDQFRQSSLGFWSKADFRHLHQGLSDPVHTPHLDEFAMQSTVLTHAVSNFPVCSPHRGSLFTGCYPNKSGVPLNCHSDRPISNLAAKQIGFTDVLAKQGYEVGYIGKWHLDYPTPNDPENEGQYVDPNQPAWDSYTEPQRRHGISYWYGYGTFDQHKNPHYYDNNGKRHEPQVWSAQHEADKAIEYLRNQDQQRDANKPFALFVSMNPPHSPYRSDQDCNAQDLAFYKDVPTEKLLIRENADLSMEKTACAPYYFANITGVDREFGRIIDELKRMGEWDNTLVVFSSDHGETLCSQGVNDAKNSIFHESISVPFLLKQPNQRTHQISNTLLSSPDIMPTILAQLGMEEHIPAYVQGRNLTINLPQSSINSSSLWQEANDASPTSALYIRNLDGKQDSSGKTTHYFAQSRGIKTHRYTLAFTIDATHNLESVLFFDDFIDPYQQVNLTFDPYGVVETRLLALLASELNRIEDPWAKQNVLPELMPYSNCKKAIYDQ